MHPGWTTTAAAAASSCACACARTLAPECHAHAAAPPVRRVSQKLREGIQEPPRSLRHARAAPVLHFPTIFKYPVNLGDAPGRGGTRRSAASVCIASASSPNAASSSDWNSSVACRGARVRCAVRQLSRGASAAGGAGIVCSSRLTDLTAERRGLLELLEPGLRNFLPGREQEPLLDPLAPLRESTRAHGQPSQKHKARCCLRTMRPVCER